MNIKDLAVKHLTLSLLYASSLIIMIIVFKTVPQATLICNWKPDTELIKIFLNFRPTSFDFIFVLASNCLDFIFPLVQSYDLSLGCYGGVLEKTFLFFVVAIPMPDFAWLFPIRSLGCPEQWIMGSNTRFAQSALMIM